jgi:hypothetical protein
MHFTRVNVTAMDASHGNPRLGFEGEGWVAYTAPGKRYATRVHVSYKPGPGRWVVDGVQFADFRVTARDLRDFPLGKIEVWINQLAQQGLVAMIDAKRPELSDTPHFAITDDTATWTPKLPPAPAKGPKGDDFYRFIGEVYGKAAMVSTRPAAELAKVWEVPVTTVHRWIREARRRGHLPPAEPGRRG